MCLGPVKIVIDQNIVIFGPMADLGPAGRGMYIQPGENYTFDRTYSGANRAALRVMYVGARPAP